MPCGAGRDCGPHLDCGGTPRASLASGTRQWHAMSMPSHPRAPVPASCFLLWPRACCQEGATPAGALRSSCSLGATKTSIGEACCGMCPRRPCAVHCGCKCAQDPRALIPAWLHVGRVVTWRRGPPLIGRVSRARHAVPRNHGLRLSFAQAFLFLVGGAFFVLRAPQTGPWSLRAAGSPVPHCICLLWRAVWWAFWLAGWPSLRAVNGGPLRCSCWRAGG